MYDLFVCFVRHFFVWLYVRKKKLNAPENSQGGSLVTFIWKYKINKKCWKIQGQNNNKFSLVSFTIYR